MNILIAECQEILREGVAAVVREAFEGARVLTAEDGPGALACAKDVKLDLAILDIDLPKLSGIETSRLLLSDHPELRIIFLTLCGESSLIQQAFEAGASGYLLKHEHPDELQRAIVAATSGNRFLSSDLKDKFDVGSMTDSGPQAVGVSCLTKRQIQVLSLVASGLSIREIASRTGLSTKTVDAHRRKICQRLEIESIADMTRVAIREGLVGLDGSITEDPKGDSS